MIERIVEGALRHRVLLLLVVTVAAAFGAFRATSLPVDAVPDITNVQVQVNTDAPGYTPEETEQRITWPVEQAMGTLPALAYTRSISRYGLSQVTVVFEDGTDLYFARQLVAERLQQVRGELPTDVRPVMGPIATGLGEIFMYTLRAAPGADDVSLADLRTAQDWIVRPQLVTVDGVVEVNAIGGHERQVQIAPDLDALVRWNLSLDDLARALERDNRNTGAGFVERNGEQWLVRAEDQITDLGRFAEIVVAEREGQVVRVDDVAEVIEGRALRHGAALRDDAEVVLGTAFMLIGENARRVAADVAARLEEIRPSLPDGVLLATEYDRTELVNATLETVRDNLLEGAVLVIVVLLLMLGNLRAAIITAAVIPLSMIFAATGMAANDVSANLMSLGAIDFGLIVDGAVIIVENCLRRLGLAQRDEATALPLDERLAVVREATLEVIRPSLFGVFVITVVYLPLFSLTGVEGRMFTPMAFTVVAALTGALLLSLTFVPAAVAVLVRGPVRHRDTLAMRGLRRVYDPVLRVAMRGGWALGAIALVIVGIGGWGASRLGTEFVPQLDEGDIAMHALRTTGTSLEQAVDMQREVARTMAEQPEVEHVFSKIGTGEVASDPMPPNVADTFIIMKPRRQWPDPTEPKAELVERYRAIAESVPGNNYEFTQPIEMRFNELLSGVRADLAVRVFGDDLDTLREAGERAAGLLSGIDGASDVRVQQTSGLPVLTVRARRDRLHALGLDLASVQEALRTATGGRRVGTVYEGDARFDLVVRLADEERRDLAALTDLPVPLPGPPGQVPLAEVATLEVIEGPSQIERRDSKRNIVVSANVDGRDLGGFVDEARSVLAARLDLPAGYWVAYGGTFEQLESASRRLAVVVPLTLALVVLLLHAAFGSWRRTALVFTAVPLALTGGVAALALRGMPLSISAAVGFIALTGIAVLNGIVMLSRMQALIHEGLPVPEAVRRGATERLRPVLMTALVAALGFLPMAINVGIGAEVQRPLATVVIGGIVSATLLTLVVLPALAARVLVPERPRPSPDPAPAAA
jgi:cobalt-zinc-cadmium resistance protein CzcA